jgi:hypothetical protein
MHTYFYKHIILIVTYFILQERLHVPLERIQLPLPEESSFVVPLPEESSMVYSMGLHSFCQGDNYTNKGKRQGQSGSRRRR